MLLTRLLPVAVELVELNSGIAVVTALPKLEVLARLVCVGCDNFAIVAVPVAVPVLVMGDRIEASSELMALELLMLIVNGGRP